MTNPERRLLVTATSTGNMGTVIAGYYHFDRTTGTHYVCAEHTLVRYEVKPETVEFVKRKNKKAN